MCYKVSSCRRLSRPCPVPCRDRGADDPGAGLNSRLMLDDLIHFCRALFVLIKTVLTCNLDEKHMEVVIFRSLLICRLHLPPTTYMSN